jgi:hypothetical protein
MVAVSEGPAATQGDEPRIPDLREDHQFAHLARMSAKVAGSAADELAFLWSVGHAFLSNGDDGRGARLIAIGSRRSDRVPVTGHRAQRSLAQPSGPGSLQQARRESPGVKSAAAFAVTPSRDRSVRPAVRVRGPSPWQTRGFSLVSRQLRDANVTA